MQKFLLTIALLLISLSIIDVSAQIPRVISYQGIITEPDGSPKPDGLYTLTLSIYDQPNGGSALWFTTETVDLKGGLFHIYLGASKPLTLNFDRPYWLGIRISNEPELTPRLPFSASPYSISSIYADTAKYIKSGGVSRPLNPPISSGEIANRTVVRSILIYPIPNSDSISILRDNIYLVAGQNARIRQSGDSIIISATDSKEISLDDAYNAEGPGKGRKIDAIHGSVWITGKDGLEIYGTEKVLQASSHQDITVGRFDNYGAGYAIEAEVSSDQNNKSAIKAISMGDSASSAITASVPVGKASAGRFIIEDNTNRNNALEVLHKGDGSGVTVAVEGEKSFGVLIESIHSNNQQNALKAIIVGEGNAILGITKEASTHLSPLFKAGVAGSSKDFYGVQGVSDKKSGVLGRTKSGGDFDLGPDSIKAGVLGLSNNLLSGSADNWGMAGIGYGYGSGVLGIAGSSGHGILGVSAGGTIFRTSGAIRGITRENPNGAWPPYFPIDEFSALGKGDVAVLGQTVDFTSLWGESINGRGLVSTTGKRVGWGDIPNMPLGIFAASYTQRGPALMASADSNHAGIFTSGAANNHYSTLRTESFQYSGAFEAVSMGAKGFAGSFSISNINNDSSAVLITNQGKGEALSVWANGSGRAAHFRTMDPQNNEITFKITNYGKNDAAYFLIPNQTNNRVALYAETYGTGNAGVFRSMNPTSSTPAVMIDNFGNNRALDVKNSTATNNESAIYASTIGTGRVADFINLNQNNSATTLYTGTFGLGPAGQFICENTNNQASVLTLHHRGRGRGLDIWLMNANNSANGILLTHDGIGRILEFNLNNSNNSSIGLMGTSVGSGHLAYLTRNNTTSSNAMVYMVSNSPAYTLYAANTSGGTNNNAGYFQGRVVVTSILSKGGGSFKIDHPLDPENKYLSHSFVESPDMKNIYDGTVLLDANGEAYVILPHYFEALNRNYRYQLTAIGASAPGLYIAEEISGNRFKIAGGKPNMKVSWQVTGIRKDPFAENNRIIVEEDKPQIEKGKYLHPEVYNKPANLSIGNQYIQNTDLNNTKMSNK